MLKGVEVSVDPDPAVYLDERLGPRGAMVPDWTTAWANTDSGQVYHEYEMLGAGALGGVIDTGGEPSRWGPTVGARRLNMERISQQIREHVRVLMSLPPDWDGDPIAESTALTALLVTLTMIDVAPEPSTAPMVDGSLIMSWLFEDGASLEIVIEEGEHFPTYAMLARDGVVEELALDSEATLRMLLAQRGQYGDPRIRRATYSF